ncbi:MAG: phospholipase D-like domain-containing protein [Novosphingobium sp.]
MTEPDDKAPQSHPSVWRYVKADRAHVVIDAAAYFDLMYEAMLLARQRIFLIGWDFDSRIRLADGRRWWNLPRRDRFPARLGSYFLWLARRTPGLHIRMLKWNFGALRYLFRGTMILDLIRWSFTPAVDFKFDSAHPLGCSHHQKIVVIDDCFAICGGIDMTSDRWDTPEHLDDDPRRRRPNGRPYGPWHDVTMMLEGEAAQALSDLGRDRWRQAGGKPMAACLPQPDTAWPERLDAEFRDVEVGIARTRAKYHETSEIREIEALFLEQIARAKRFIYAENQYFASPSIAEAIAERVSEPDPPEIVLVTPLTSDGWLQQAAMDGARTRLLHAIGERDHASRFRVYVPVTACGTPIYVHAKLMIVDDEIIRVGSANMNNRSMGLDSEADVFIDAARPGNEHAASAIANLRCRLLAEHCGITEAELAELLVRHGTMAGAIAAAPNNGKRLEPFVLRPLTDTEKALADNALLDPERPEEFFEPISRRGGLFRRGGILRRPV